MLSRLTLSRRRRPSVDVPLQELNANPYPIWRQLRADHPVAYVPMMNHYWLVTRWAEVEAVLKDDETFSAEVETGMPANLDSSLLFTDDPEHARMRAAMQPPCQPRPAREFARTFVSRVADELIDSLAAAGTADLVDSFFEPLAAKTLKALAGIDVRTADLRIWVDHTSYYFRTQLPPPEARTTDKEMDRVIQRHLETQSIGDGSSVLTSMAGWKDADGGLDEQQIVGSLKVFLAAGLHELRDLMSHALLGLLSRPEQLAELQADPSLARPAIEEAARWASPVGMVPRRTTRPVELAGVRIPADAYVAAIVASANRDETRFTDPGRFDLHRDEGAHLAFASGVHFCLGAWLSREGGAAGLSRLVERLPGLRLTPGGRLEVTGWRFREVHRLQADWS